MSKTLLSIENICKDFVLPNKSTSRALNNVNQSISAGQALALIGESGSGKSTLAKIIMGLHKPTNGKIIFQNQDIHQLSSRKDILNYRKNVQLLFQDPFSSLNPTKSIFYHLARAVKLHQDPPSKKDLRQAVENALEQVELNPAKDFIERFPYQLSGGQRQRVNIARLLAVGAKLVLADEPTSMLDVSIRVGILNLLLKLKEEGMSFLYISHDIASARYLADKIAVIYCGHILECGDTESVIQNPQHPYTQVLIDATPDPNQSISKALPLKPSSDTPVWHKDSQGCPFASRCPKAKKECTHTFPNSIEINKHHHVHCCLY